MADPAFKITRIVRDFPVDYSVLLENLVDFDHGPFAHQAAAFDMYSGTSRDPQEVNHPHPLPDQTRPTPIERP
jgi:hypothetical protein